jgi:autotransporter-associated beta strand protein
MRRAITLLSLAALSVAVLGQTAQAVIVTWNGSANTDWTNGANWDGGVAPADDTTTDVAQIATVAANQPSLAGARSVGQLDIEVDAGGLNLSGAGTLTPGNAILGSGGTGLVGIHNGSTAATANVISLAGISTNGANPLNIECVGSGGLTISSVISGAGGLVRYGSSLLTLSGLNTYTGPTSIVEFGAINFNSIGNVGGGASALGAPTTVADGTITLGAGTASGTLRYTGAGNSTDRVINLGGTTGQAFIFNDGTGPLTLTGNVTATGAGTKNFNLRGTNTGDNTISGSIVDNSASNKTNVAKTNSVAGPGKWILAGTNTYTGTTTVAAGTLLINGNNSAATGAVSVTGGVFGGTGTIGGAVTIGSAGTLAPGASPGNLTLLNSLTLTSGSKFLFELGAVGASDEVTMSSSTLNLNSQKFTDFTFTNLAGFGAGTYTLFDAGTITGSLGAPVSGTVGGLSSTLAISGNDLVLNVVPEPGALAILATGLIPLLAYAWRKRR